MDSESKVSFQIRITTSPQTGGKQWIFDFWAETQFIGVFDDVDSQSGAKFQMEHVISEITSPLSF